MVTNKITKQGLCAYRCQGIGEATVCFDALSKFYINDEYDIYMHLTSSPFPDQGKIYLWRGAINLNGHAEESLDGS